MRRQALIVPPQCRHSATTGIPVRRKYHAAKRFAELGTRVQFPPPTSISAIPQTHRYPCDRVLPGSAIVAVSLRGRRSVTLARTPRPVWPGVNPQGRFGNKMGTGLATSAQCGYNARASGQYRNCPAIKAFKYHRNVFPIPRVWQTYRTQNTVLARGCGFNSYLRYSPERSFRTYPAQF
jgi:hypothetical protein